MARKRDRIFAFSLALLFFVTAFGFSFFVIWQAVHSSNSSNNSSNNQSCSTASSIASSTTLPTPAVYKPSGKLSSLQTTDLTIGSGKVAKAGDCVVVKYYGTLASDGSVFDEDFDQPMALEFQLGQGQVIPGWDQGIVGMKIGGTRRLAIPAALAYGSQAKTDPTTGKTTIPANSDLVFVVQLSSIQ